MIETIVVRNSGDNFISVTTNDDSIIKRITKSGLIPYRNQGEFTQYRMSKKWFRLIQNGFMIKEPLDSRKKIAV